jgi:hypothetical protein
VQEAAASFSDVFLGGFLAEGIHLCVHDLKRLLRAFAEAGPQAVAVLLGHEPRLAVYNLDGALGTRGDAYPAAIAFIFVDPDDLSDAFHDDLLLLKIPDIGK